MRLWIRDDRAGGEKNCSRTPALAQQIPSPAAQDDTVLGSAVSLRAVTLFRPWSRRGNFSRTNLVCFSANPPLTPFPRVEKFFVQEKKPRTHRGFLSARQSSTQRRPLFLPPFFLPPF